MNLLLCLLLFFMAYSIPGPTHTLGHHLENLMVPIIHKLEQRLKPRNFPMDFPMEHTDKGNPATKDEVSIVAAMIFNLGWSVTISKPKGTYILTIDAPRMEITC